MKADFDREPPIEVSPRRRLALTVEVLGALVAMVAITVAAWLTVKDDLKSANAANSMQDKRLELLETRSELQRDVLYELRADMKANREQTALVIEMLKANRGGSNRE